MEMKEDHGQLVIIVEQRTWRSNVLVGGKLMLVFIMKPWVNDGCYDVRDQGQMCHLTPILDNYVLFKKPLVP